MFDSCIPCVVIWLRDVFQLTSNQDKLVSTKSTDFKCLILQGHGNELSLIIGFVNALISFFPEKCQKINAAQGVSY